MTLTIDEKKFPRVLEMVLVLVDHADEIEALSSAHVKMDYSQFQVKYYPPQAPKVRKIERQPEGCR